MIEDRLDLQGVPLVLHDWRLGILLLVLNLDSLLRGKGYDPDVALIHSHVMGPSARFGRRLLAAQNFLHLLLTVANET